MDDSPKVDRDTRLDMNHGFVKSIIRNQLDRDRYDKECKGKQAKVSRTTAISQPRPTQRRPDRAIYAPPTGGISQQGRQALFMLEFIDNRSGTVRHQPFMAGSDLVEFCADFAKKTGLDDRLERALYHRLLQEVPNPK